MDERGRLIVEQIPSLRRYARALTGEPALADDLVQDCLLRAWSRFHLWRRGSDIRPWLFTILHNIYANAVREAKRRPPTVPLGEGQKGGEVRPLQEDAVEIRSLVAALARLPEEQRQVVLLVGLEEMTYEETSKLLHIPIGTVMSRLSRGRERLRRLMSGLESPAVESLSSRD